MTRLPFGWAVPGASRSDVRCGFWLSRHLESTIVQGETSDKSLHSSKPQSLEHPLQRVFIETLGGSD